MALAQGRFGRDQRIRKRSEFRGILNGGVRVSTSHCVFIVASRQAGELGLHQPRLGLVVSRKVGCAVLRNRFKRLAREVFRKSVVQLPADADIVLIAKHWSLELHEANLAAEWSSANERIAAAFERHCRKSARGATC